MIVYSDRSRKASTRKLLEELSTLTDPLERLIAFGEWEAGVTDALFPEQDDISNLSASMRSLSLTLGRGDLEQLLAFDLPNEIEIHVPEGYAFYALYPEQYIEAVRQFSERQPPGHCWVVGIRSIGTSLSGVVGAELRKFGWEVDSFTVRPHGHPFDRHVSLTRSLESRICQDLSSWFAIVDEGPGLSGSSFASVASRLTELGVPDRKIVLFPSWLPNVEGFRSERARQQWPRHSKFVSVFRPEWAVPMDALDISAGNWRDVVYDAHEERPAVQPQHERRKYLEDGDLWKFAGLGRYGRTKLDRAQCLSEAGFIPPVRSLEHGFLRSRFVPGKPLRPSDVDSWVTQRLAAYLAFVKDSFPVPGRVPYASLVQMISVNTGRVLPDLDPVVEGGELVAIDGRMLPHEWISTDIALLKTDALDHHDDHFFPGCADIAWDIAGASIEFRMSVKQEEQFVTAYLHLRPDPTLHQRLQFYKVAYLAYRIGYVSMAGQSLAHGDDRRRFEELRDYYSSTLQSIPTP